MTHVMDVGAIFMKCILLHLFMRCVSAGIFDAFQSDSRFGLSFRFVFVFFFLLILKQPRKLNVLSEKVIDLFERLVPACRKAEIPKL